MWGLLFSVCLVVSCTASKEYAARGNLDLEESKLLLEIVKRLQDNQFSHQDRSQEEETEKDSTQSGQCEVSTKQSLIIRKKDSEKNGATFLSLFKDVLKNDDCSNLCCQNASCDLAVYENKDDHYCYLFRCNGKCMFGKHSSYTSNDIIHHKQSDNAAQDLDGIEQEHENDNSEEVAKGEFSTTPIAKALTATVANEFLQAIRAHSVGLDGMCQNDIHCEDPNAECKNRHCICQENFYKKNRICRKVCPPSNFECVDLGTHGRGPQCVMQSQVCDGTTHCADGTDEYNCPDTDTSIKTRTDADKPSKQVQHHLPGERDEESSNTDASDSQAESPEDNHPAVNKPNNTSMHATNPDNINHNGNIQDQTDVDAKSQENGDSYLVGMVDSAKHRISEDTKDPAIDKSKLVVTQSPQMDSKLLPSSTDDHVNHGHIDTISNVKEKFSENVDKSHNTAGAAHSAETGTGSHDHFIIQEEIQMPEAQSESMQGPIIALALGLAFTFILLVFVACRLRTVRQRLRKGRPLHSNEADYLINGMYL